MSAHHSVLSRCCIAAVPGILLSPLATRRKQLARQRTAAMRAYSALTILQQQQQRRRRLRVKKGFEVATQ